MEATCQRCHEILREADLYCPACGLPQLIYVASEPPPLPVGDGASASSVERVVFGDGIAWRPALRSAAILAIPAGVLCSGMTPVGLICVVGAAVWAVSLYSRRAHPGGVSTGNGARIGLITGLLASWLGLALSGIELWVERFVLHQGGRVDSMILAPIQTGLDYDKQILAQMGVMSAEANQIMQRTQASMLSAEGRAGYVLAAFVIGAAILIFFATVGGALGARFVTQTRRPGA